MTPQSSFAVVADPDNSLVRLADLEDHDVTNQVTSAAPTRATPTCRGIRSGS